MPPLRFVPSAPQPASLLGAHEQDKDNPAPHSRRAWATLPLPRRSSTTCTCSHCSTSIPGLLFKVKWDQQQCRKQHSYSWIMYLEGITNSSRSEGGRISAHSCYVGHNFILEMLRYFMNKSQWFVACGSHRGQQKLGYSPGALLNSSWMAPLSHSPCGNSGTASTDIGV